jgi:prepilin-type N-terminal cleavage/methylation domain-containing protein
MKRARGFTAIEVLVSMTLFAIGAAAIVSMMRVSVQGNADARRFDIATQIAAEWQARLQRDAMAWTAPNKDNPSSNIGNTQFLKDATDLPSPLGADVGWQTPPTPAADSFGTSFAFDVLGREVQPNATDIFFCVNYRLDYLDVTQLATSPIRAEVRVFWPRFEQAPPANCNPPANNTLFHFLTTTTLVRKNAS